MLPSLAAGGRAERVRRAVAWGVEAVTGGPTTVAGRLDAIPDGFDAAIDRLDAAIDRLDATTDRFDAVSGRYDAAVDRLDAARRRVDAAVDRLPTPAHRLEATTDRLAAATDPTTGVARRVAARLDAARRRVDDVRVREHLRRTERALREADHGRLSADQRRRRERNLDRLRAYRRADRFPRNERTGERSPVFVGAEGTRCALGHLLAEDGREDLVAAVMDADPLVYVEELGDGDTCESSDGRPDGPILEWVEANGFTRAEAARIQPGYAHAVRFATTCGPVPCWLAGALASLVGLSVAAASEYVGYRLVGDRFPDDALKRRGALGYVTLMNLFLGALVAALVYALFP